MKRFSVLLILCTLLLCITACGSGIEFESTDAMMKHLEGMWLLEDGYSNQTYYIFQDGKIYSFTDTSFENFVEKRFESLLQEEGAAAWYEMDFETFANMLKTEAFWGSAIDNVQKEPKKGKILLNEGEHSEMLITIKEGSVLIKEADEKYSKTLAKIADTVDLSGEHFRAIYDEVRQDFTVPSSLFWKSTEEYAQIIRELKPEINNWILVEEQDSIIYTKNGKTTNAGGIFVISNDGVTLTEGKSASGDSAAFVIMYHPQSEIGSELFVSDMRGTDLASVIQFAAPTVEDFPQALTVSEICELFYRDSTVSNGLRSLETTVNGVTYKVSRTTDDSTTLIFITANTDIPLVSAGEGQGSYTPEQSPETEETHPEDASIKKDLTHEDVFAALDQYGDASLGVMSSVKEYTHTDGVVQYQFLIGDKTVNCSIFEKNGKVYQIAATASSNIYPYSMDTVSAGERYLWHLKMCAQPAHVVNYPLEDPLYIPQKLIQASEDLVGHSAYTDGEWRYTLDVWEDTGFYGETIRNYSISATNTRVEKEETVPVSTQPPEETEPPAAPLQSENDVPYTIPLDASVTVYGTPGYEYNAIGSIGEDGVYTIVEEQFDSRGNLWGRLKSGIGWVCITDYQQTETNTDGSVLYAPNPLKFSSEVDGIVYDINFVFEENGTVYIAYAPPRAGAVGGGSGTYTLANEILTLSIMMFGKWEEYSFELSETDTLTLVQKSDKGIFYTHQSGDVFHLEENTDTTKAKVKEIATHFEKPVDVSW